MKVNRNVIYFYPFGITIIGSKSASSMEVPRAYFGANQIAILGIICKLY